MFARRFLNACVHLSSFSGSEGDAVRKGHFDDINRILG